MPEHDVVVDDQKLHYEGYMDLKEVLALIDTHLRESGYVKHDASYKEDVMPEGKHIEIQKQPYKRVKEYASILLDISIVIDNLKEASVEVGGHKKHIQEANLTVAVNGILQTDMRNRWEGKAVSYFIASIYDQWVHKWKADRIKAIIPGEVQGLMSEISSVLKMYKY